MRILPVEFTATMVPPLRLIVLAHAEIPHVRAAWEAVESQLHNFPGLELTVCDLGEGIDFASVYADVAMVFGGDGAILRACRQMGYHQVPILGVNLGRLGFLADVSLQILPEILPQLVAREYRIVSHLMYSATWSPQEGAQQTFLGLNEVAVCAGASFRMFDIELRVNDERVTTYSGDGLIISTPVGSTAHSLSAGGPILRQDLQAFVITPICPHTISVRPIVDSADCIYQLQPETLPDGVSLIIDGQLRLPMSSGDRVEIRRAPVEFQLVKFPGMTFYGTLHRKLGWGGQPLYRLR